MKKEISLAEAAQELQLSKTTISRALSGKGRIGKETQDRIARFLEEQNAVVKTRSGMEKSKNIAILFPMLCSFCFIPVCSLVNCSRSHLLISILRPIP